MSIREDLFQAGDVIDAAVFYGKAFTDPEHRAWLRLLMARWGHALGEHDFALGCRGRAARPTPACQASYEQAMGRTKRIPDAESNPDQAPEALVHLWETDRESGKDYFCQVAPSSVIRQVLVENANAGNPRDLWVKVVADVSTPAPCYLIEEVRPVFPCWLETRGIVKTWIHAINDQRPIHLPNFGRWSPDSRNPPASTP